MLLRIQKKFKLNPLLKGLILDKDLKLAREGLERQVRIEAELPKNHSPMSLVLQKRTTRRVLNEKETRLLKDLEQRETNQNSCLDFELFKEDDSIQSQEYELKYPMMTI